MSCFHLSIMISNQNYEKVLITGWVHGYFICQLMLIMINQVHYQDHSFILTSVTYKYAKIKLTTIRMTTSGKTHVRKIHDVM